MMVPRAVLFLLVPLVSLFNVAGALASDSQSVAALKQDAGKEIDKVKTVVQAYYGKEQAKGVLDSLDKSKQVMQSSKVFSNVNADNIKTACEGIATALPKLMSNDTLDVILGVTSALSSIAVLGPPPVGQVLAGIFSVATGVLGVSTGKTKSTGQIVEEALKKHLKAERVKELRDDIMGAKEVINNAMTLLTTYRDEDHWTYTQEQRAFELNYIGQQVKLRDGLALMGRLNSMIYREATTGKKESVPAVFELARAYVPLASIRLALLTALYWTYADSDATRSIELSIQQMIQQDIRQNYELFNSLFVEAPPEYTHIKSKFDKNDPQNKIMVSYMKNLGLDVNARTLKDCPDGEACCYEVYSIDKPGYLWRWEKFKYLTSETGPVIRSIIDIVGKTPFGFLPYAMKEASHNVYNVELVQTKDQRTRFKFKSHSGLYTIQTSDPSDKSWDNWLYSATDLTGTLEAYDEPDQVKNPERGFLFKLTKVGGKENTYYVVNQGVPDYPLVHSRLVEQLKENERIYSKGVSNPGEAAFWQFKKVSCYP